jgi:hypothetical protein
MKKIVLITLFAVIAILKMDAQVSHFLKFEELWNSIKTEAEADGPATLSSGNKYLLNADREIDIFKFVSPSSRTFRIDKEYLKFENGVETTVRLETNGASNATNGRKVYINCPSAGTLTVGGYTATAGRGYTLETETGTVISDAASAALTVPEDKQNISVQTYPITEAGIVVLNPDSGIYYGFLQFDEAGASAIQSIEVQKEIKSIEYFDLLGRKQIDGEIKNSVLIRKTTYTDGTTSAGKVARIER